MGDKPTRDKAVAVAPIYDARQDPLPEPTFGWRRGLTFFAVTVNLILTACIVWKVDDARALMWIALALIMSNIVFAFLYMAGASMVDLARVVKSANLRFGLMSMNRPDGPPPEETPYAEVDPGKP